MQVGNKVSRRYIKSLETKNKIFTTALMLFAKHGYDEVKIDDITKYAGISRATFYAYFKSKEEVIVEQFRKIDEHYATVFKSVPDNTSAYDRLQLLATLLAEYCADICGITVVKVTYISQIGLGEDAVILSKDRVFFSIIKEIVRQARKEKLIPTSVKDNELAELIARFMRAPVFDWCLYDGSFDLRRAMARQCRIIKKLMLNTGSPHDAHS